MSNSMDEVGACDYLEPIELQYGSSKRVDRQHSANDSGIADLRPSYFSSKFGLPNDAYQPWDSETDTEEARRDYFQSDPVRRLSYGHGSAKYVKDTRQSDYDELSYPVCKNMDGSNPYTHIDESTVITPGPVCAAAPVVRGRVVSPDLKQAMVMAMVAQQNGHILDARRRSNPIYDVTGSARYPPKNHNQCSFCCGVQAIGFLFALIAIVLAAFSIVAGLTGRFTDQRYDDLERKYQDLANNCTRGRGNGSSSAAVDQQQTSSSLRIQLSSLQSLIDLQEVAIQNLTNQIETQENMIQRLNTNYANITNKVTNLRKDLSYEINQVTHGLTNMTQCVHRVRTSGVPAVSSVTRTIPLDLQNSTVLSVVCSTEGGTQAFLEYDPNFPNVYTCACSGRQSNNTTSRYCYIHYWICPIVP